MEAVPVPKITYEDLKDVLRNDGNTEKDGVLNFETATFQQIVTHNEKLVWLKLRRCFNDHAKSFFTINNFLQARLP